MTAVSRQDCEVHRCYMGTVITVNSFAACGVIESFLNVKPSNTWVLDFQVGCNWFILLKCLLKLMQGERHCFGLFQVSDNFNETKLDQMMEVLWEREDPQDGAGMILKVFVAKDSGLLDNKKYYKIE